jgi:electron transfer flavoprotein beta subunit
VHIVVCVKQVPDLEKIRIKAETREPVLEGLPVRLGDFDKCALEEAVRLKESLGEAKVTAVAVGSPRLKDTIKEALAIGADEAVILTDTAFQGGDEMGTARTLARVVARLGEADLILTGEGSADDHTGQVPSRLAELLGLPQVTYVRQLALLGERRVRAVRDLEEALEVVEVDLPAVVSVTGEINTPRLPPLTAILKAARKPVATWGPGDIGLDPAEVGAAASTVTVLSNLAPASRRKQVVLEGSADEVVDELLKALDREGALTA